MSKKNRFGYDPTEDNFGQPSIGTDGDLNIGIGGGLAIDPFNGELGIEVAPGFTIDF